MKIFFLLLIVSGSINASSDIAVLSLAIGSSYEQSVRSSIENKKAYCKKHGYDFIISTDSYDLDRYPAWSKIKLIERVLQTGKYKWIFWSDADALFMNMAFKLEELIDDDYDFIGCKDCNGFNLGNFFLKNTAWSFDLLKEIYKDKYKYCRIWENGAFIEIVENDPSYLLRMKVIPQRLMNSYHPPQVGKSTEAYQVGDFIIHFPGLTPEKYYLDLYKNKTVDSKDNFTLECYFEIYGCVLHRRHLNLNKKYMTNLQKVQFQKRLSQYDKQINTILEIGFNTGYLAEMFCEAKPSAKLYAIDPCQHRYVSIAKEFMSRKYGDRFTFIKGNSEEILSQLALERDILKFDLIYLEGEGDFTAIMSAIKNCSYYAHKETVIWINNYYSNVKRVIDLCEKEGLLKIINHYQSIDSAGVRSWVEVSFIVE